jgi:hypothetical protein
MTGAMVGEGFFLAKAGEIFGPYTETDIERLRESGEYHRYSWVWDTRKPGWQPTDPTPMAPKAPVSKVPTAAPMDLPGSAPAMTAPAAPTPIQAARPNIDVSHLSVLCYDHHQVLSGTLVHVSEGGCEFISDNFETSPVFMMQVPISMNLLDHQSGQTMTVRSRVAEVARKDGRWHYRLFWKKCPEIIAA